MTWFLSPIPAGVKNSKSSPFLNGAARLPRRDCCTTTSRHLHRRERNEWFLALCLFVRPALADPPSASAARRRGCGGGRKVASGQISLSLRERVRVREPYDRST